MVRKRFLALKVGAGLVLMAAALVTGCETDLTELGTRKPVYKIWLDVAEYDFGSGEELDVTVTNIGNQPTGELSVALSGANAGSFTVSSSAIESIDETGDSKDFTVGPVAGLATESHATVTVSGENGISAVLEVNFKPSTPAGNTGIILNKTGTRVFPSLREAGYAAADLIPITVIVTSLQEDTGSLTVSLSGKKPKNPESFVLSKTTSFTDGIKGIGQSKTFTVKPAVGLTGGVHTADLTVSNEDGSISAGFTVQVRVTGTSIAANLGIDVTGEEPGTENSSEKVTEVFTALHEYLKNKTPEEVAESEILELGYYIDLASLEVDPYPADTTYGQIALENGPLVSTNLSFGYKLRLILVGINSYGGDKPHLVFQFQNLPGAHRWNPGTNNTNTVGTAGGYEGSEVRQYLIGNFLNGLKTAGVPEDVLVDGVREDVLFAPERSVWNGFTAAEITANTTPSENTKIDTITDKVFLPTEYEMYDSSSVSNYETADNQAHFEYYTSDTLRTKCNTSGSTAGYFLASPNKDNGKNACAVYSNGGFMSVMTRNNIYGIAPVFVVK
jgi:hypothetical protein